MVIKRLKILAFFILFLGISGHFGACKTAEGCQLEEKYQVKTDKNGNLSKKKGKSGLWSKKQQKRMRSGK